MANFAKWIISTLLLTGLMTASALILFTVATPLAEALGKQFRIDDDWVWLTLPIGGMGGMILGIWKRRRAWLRVTSGVLLALATGAIVQLSIPIEAPESVPEGMNRLPYGLGNMIRVALLYIALITAGICLALATTANVIVALFDRLRSGGRGVDSRQIIARHDLSDTQR